MRIISKLELYYQPNSRVEKLLVSFDYITVMSYMVKIETALIVFVTA